MAENEMRLHWESLQDFTRKIFETAGLPPQDAAIEAEVLVWANLRGIDSHGVLRLPWYLDFAERGVMNVRPDIRVLKETPAVLYLDADRAFGPVVTVLAMEKVVEKARQVGIGWALIRNLTHQGAMAYYSLMAARAGMAGMAIVCSPPNMAPFGARAAGLHNSPIAIAVPAADHPIVVDFATCAVSEGKVRLYKTEGKRVPDGWVLDGEGNFSTDPNDAYEDGAIAPLGGDQGHKGYGLAVAIDLLGGILSGATSAAMAGRYGNNFLFQVIDPGAFGDPSDFRRGIEDYVHYVTSARRRDGVDQILLPGQIEQIRRAEHLEHGLRIEPEVWNQLKELGRSMGIELEEV